MIHLEKGRESINKRNPDNERKNTESRNGQMDKSVRNKTNETISQPKNELADEGPNERMDGSGMKVAGCFG